MAQERCPQAVLPFQHWIGQAVQVSRPQVKLQLQLRNGQAAEGHFPQAVLLFQLAASAWPSLPRGKLVFGLPAC